MTAPPTTAHPGFEERFSLLSTVHALRLAEAPRGQRERHRSQRSHHRLSEGKVAMWGHSLHRRRRLRCRRPTATLGEPVRRRRRLLAAPQDGAAGPERRRAEATGGSSARRDALHRAGPVLAAQEGGREEASAAGGSARFPSAPLARRSPTLPGWVRGWRCLWACCGPRPPTSLGRGGTAEGGTAGASGKANSSGGGFAFGAWRGRRGGVYGTQIGSTGPGLFLSSAKCRPSGLRQGCGGLGSGVLCVLGLEAAVSPGVRACFPARS